MDEKVKESVLALLDAAEAELKAGNTEAAHGVGAGQVLLARRSDLQVYTQY